MAAGRGLRYLVSILRGRGVAVDPVLRRAGLDPILVADSEARLPTRAITVFFAEAAEAVGDPDLGLHAAERVQPEFMGELGYLLRCSPTLGEGMQRVGRYQRFVSDSIVISAQADVAEAYIAVGWGAARARTRQLSEFALTAALVMARQETGVDLRPRAVEFAHRAPRDVSEHRRVFGAPLRFDSAHNRLVLSRSQFDLPFRRADHGLCALLENRVREVIARLPSGEGVADHARRLLARELEAGRPTASAVGRGLGMSVRTLHRKLQAEDTSLRALRDEVRRDLARVYLSERLPINEVAFLLGYSEASAFHRSFKRWTGLTPARYQQEEARA